MNIKTFKKGIERNYLRSKRMLRLNPHDDFSKGFSEALEGVQGMYPLLNESGKVKIPEYVAKYLEWMRDVNQFNDPYIILNSIMSGMCAETDVEKEGSQTAHWLEDRPKNIKTFVEACTNGYEVKKDPKYRVRVKGIGPGKKNVLRCRMCTKSFELAGPTGTNGFKTEFTKKWLKDNWPEYESYHNAGLLEFEGVED
ncbi:hypothetical protein PLO_1633 [Pediococcus acidilactici NGRI 0510Q]|uniref:DUF1642 domain-containing protein n=1 Tax=Pediococcus acidilactici TaxID=1254 RepID=UPI00029DE051|nr:DUF1642 domain-containing protein [Pediococcus acidilactici]KRN89918.1 hypothetical protein IV82_GL001934 [Pediococcus acidilactici]QQC13499.1 DUF1642 domain-containing protein [Pediococcus acidilactici]GAC46161.1 hypothetical protein PLO_1633 [Pediococcus acidilactici NGRI 0510Q]